METNAIKVAEVVGPVFLVLGLSFLLYLKTWQKIMGSWLKNHYELIPLFIVQLVAGIIIVRMYSVWEWNIWLLVTLSGWTMIIKSVTYFLIPGGVTKWALSLKKLTSLLALSSLLLTLWGGVLSYYAYLPQ
ncbi:MAG: hypothetical protein WCX95_04855 [Candidatus Gracilibacteria bacterium]